MKRFVDLLWPEEPPGHLLIWTLPDKRSLWAATRDEAHAHATTASGDVYIEVACGPDPRSLGRPPESSRIKSDEAVAIPGLFADLDCSPHPSKVHFDSKEQARRFLGELPMQPTAIVDSGGGLHAWWLFKEPWVFDTPDERRRAERYEYGWTDYLRRKAIGVGVRDGVDHVKDLARVLRYPGTLNHKYRTPREVTLLAADGPRADHTEFEVWESDVVGRKVTAAELASIDLRMTADTNPPFEKLNRLMEIDPKLKATWHRKRKLSDDSKSGFDMSLATQLALFGWGAEEIAATLVSWRREHGLELKLRQQYYEHTIAKAFAFRDQIRAEEAVESGELAPGSDEQLLTMVQTVTGVPVERIVAHGSWNHGSFTATVGGRERLLGSLRQAMSWDSWLALSFAFGTVQTQPKRARWNVVLRAMQRIVEYRTSEDAEESSIFDEWVRGYLQIEGRSHDTQTGADFAEILAGSYPYRSNGRAYINLRALRKSLIMDRERITESELVRMFRGAGFVSIDQKQARDRSGRVVKCRYWESPEEYLTDGD